MPKVCSMLFIYVSSTIVKFDVKYQLFNPALKLEFNKVDV